MLFWITCAALAALVAGAILAPFWHARRTVPADAATAPDSAAAYDLRVYRDQLREVDRDLERGVIAAEDAGRLRTEIGRKVLDADRRLSLAAAAPHAPSGSAIAAVLLMALTVAGALAIYLREGAPDQPDLPLAARFAAAEQVYQNRLGQSAAERAAPPVTPAVPDARFAELIEELRRVVAERPEDPEGLILLAQNEARLGNIPAALDAQRKLVDLRGDQVSSAELTQMAALMVEAAGGLITPEAEDVLAHALKVDPHNPQARYMVGLLQAQNGRPDRTFPIWAQLLAEGPADAPWIAPIRATIMDLAWIAGDPNYQPPEVAAAAMPTLPGPDADAMAAAEEMTPEQRQQMIQGMVQQLETRLATQGGSPEEWARLISSLVQIGNAEHARAIWAEAQTRFADAPEAIAPIRAAAEAAGLTE